MLGELLGLLLLVPCQLAAGSALAAVAVYRPDDIAGVVVANVLGGLVIGMSLCAAFWDSFRHVGLPLVFLEMGVAPMLGPVIGAAVYDWNEAVQSVECGMLGGAVVFLVTVCACFLWRTLWDALCKRRKTSPQEEDVV